MKILMIDIGGSNVKVIVSGNEEMRKAPSGRELTADRMVGEVKALTQDWEYDAITIGFPGLVSEGKLLREPLNLSGGWLEYDFERAFGRPVQIINDAALQALANYRGGRMLFIGFGTSIGVALAVDDVIVSVESGLIPLRSRETFMSRLTKEARRLNGQRTWQRDVHEAVVLLQDIFWPNDTVIGGGNAKNIEPLPDHCRRTGNREGILGAARLWPGAADLYAKSHGTTWRIQPFGSNGSRREEPSFICSEAD